MRTNYVLIDFDNLQPELLEALDLEHLRVMVFIGANQPAWQSLRQGQRLSCRAVCALTPRVVSVSVPA